MKAGQFESLGGLTSKWFGLDRYEVGQGTHFTVLSNFVI